MTEENHRIRFMYNNLVEHQSTGKLFSSEKSPAVFNNVLNKNRSQLWMPTGNFTITTSNQKIYIHDGANKTATVPAGNYATPQLLATAIKTALNAVSSDWDCAYLASFTFRITRINDGTLQFSNQLNSIWRTLGYVSLLNGTGTIFNSDEIRNHTGEYCEFDFGYNAQVRFIALIGLVDEEFTLSTDATVRVRANNLNDFEAPPLDINCEITRSGVLQFLENETAPYRYWRIDIIDPLNTEGPESFKFSNLYMGDYLSFTDKNIANGLVESIKDLSTFTTSETGAKYYNRKLKYSEFSSVAFTLIKKDQKKVLTDLFRRVGKTEAFYISFDPLKKISETTDEFTRLVTWKEDPTFIQVIRGYYNVSISFEEAV